MLWRWLMRRRRLGRHRGAWRPRLRLYDRCLGRWRCPFGLQLWRCRLGLWRGAVAVRGGALRSRRAATCCLVPPALHASAQHGVPFSSPLPLPWSLSWAEDRRNRRSNRLPFHRPAHGPRRRAPATAPRAPSGEIARRVVRGRAKGTHSIGAVSGGRLGGHLGGRRWGEGRSGEGRWGEEEASETPETAPETPETAPEMVAVGVGERATREDEDGHAGNYNGDELERARRSGPDLAVSALISHLRSGARGLPTCMHPPRVRNPGGVHNA